MDFTAVADEILNLNVGGCIYTTSRSTLTRYPDSMLGSMFSDRLPTNLDDRNRYVIDGDGPTFRHILNFLRRSKLILPDGFKEWDILSAEADYYQIQELIQTINETKKRIQQDALTTSYEFLEVECDRRHKQWVIYCKPHLIDHLLATSENWFVGGLKGRECQDFKSLCTSTGLEGVTVIRHAQWFTRQIHRPQLFNEITKFGFTLASTCSMGGVGNDSYALEHKWTFSRKEVTEE